MKFSKPCVVDAHYDLLNDVFRLRRKGERKVIERFYLSDLRTAGVNVLICSLFVSNDYVPEMALRVALDQVGMLHCEMEESPGLFSLCRNAEEVKQTVEAGRTALLLSLEGADPLGSDLVLLRVFYELGVRFLGLAWSRRNQAADGCHFRPMREGTTGGLTPFGVVLVEEAQRLGMIIDVSHLNDAGFSDMLTFASRPFIASHSNARALCGSARNLTDDQIRALAARGGVMGLNNMLHFVWPYEDSERPDPDSPPALQVPEGRRAWEGLLDHARHIVEIAGEDHVGFGFDLCEFSKPEDERDLSVFRNYRETVPFIEAVKTAFPGEIGEKILHGNWMRIIETLR